MWLLLTYIFCVPHTILEYWVIELLKDLSQVLDKVEVVVLNKFFMWLQRTIPYKFIASILKTVLSWYRRVWLIGKVMLWLLFCLLVLPKFFFVFLYIAVYLLVWRDEFSTIFLALLFVILVVRFRRFTIFLKKIIKKGELSFAQNYEEITAMNVSIIELRGELIALVTSLTKTQKLSYRMSLFVVSTYIAISDSLFFFVIGLCWLTISYAVVCTVKISPTFILVLIVAMIFSWTD